MSRKKATDQAEATDGITEPGNDPNGPIDAQIPEGVDKKFVPAPDPFEVRSDKPAGIRLFQSRRHNDFTGMVIQFGKGLPEDKPSDQVIAKVKEFGYHWHSPDKVWRHEMRSSNASIVRYDADRLFNELVKTIYAEKGIEKSPGVSA
jgi:hypothetical protein